jgi:hypothetical protein
MYVRTEKTVKIIFVFINIDELICLSVLYP